MAMKSGVPGSLRRQVFREGGYRCALCSLQGREHRHASGAFTYPTSKPGIFLSIDHIVARANGGASNRENLRVLCVPCNTQKGVRHA